ncbi:MAG: Uncharacterised protein [SAR116 cluster bacterium MED-G04]|nr:MAG: Uncharacterised protein [SAR116 cluster bacterium MED-G04]
MPVTEDNLPVLIAGGDGEPPRSLGDGIQHQRTVKTDVFGNVINLTADAPQNIPRLTVEEKNADFFKDTKRVLVNFFQRVFVNGFGGAINPLAEGPIHLFNGGTGITAILAAA